VTGGDPRSAELHARAYYERLKALPPGRYDPWAAGNVFLSHERERVLAELLRRHGWRDRLEHGKVLEIGCGIGESMVRLRLLGARCENLYGIELLPERVADASRRWPELQIGEGDASDMAFQDGSFDVVLQSTVLTSVLDATLRVRIAQEMMRVLKRDGVILWYDFRVSNPWNRDVRGISRREVLRLFPGMEAVFRRVTLIPPLARFLAPRALWLARVLNGFSCLRTHHWALLWWRQ
jgi:ubiquinone/menaquinone biosynthesis C-methylase UbiE